MPGKAGENVRVAKTRYIQRDHYLNVQHRTDQGTIAAHLFKHLIPRK